MSVAEPACAHCGEPVWYSQGPVEVSGAVMGAVWLHRRTGKMECER